MGLFLLGATIDDTQNMVVRVVCPNGQYGSGVSIKQGILTAAHVILDEKNRIFTGVQLETFSGGKYDCLITKVDVQKDLALLKCRYYLKRASIAKKMPKVGDKIWLIGNGYGVRNGYKTGSVGAIQDPFIMLDCRIMPGDSGGGTFNSDGELVGINDAVQLEFGGPTGYGLSVSRDTIVDFLKD